MLDHDATQVSLTDDAPARCLSMSSHGEAVRAASPGGAVICSLLPIGVSRIVAEPASLRFVLQGEETYTIEGRARSLKSGEFLLVEPNTDSTVRTSPDAVGLCIYLPAPIKPVLRDDLGSPAIIGSALDPLSRHVRIHAAAAARGAGLDPSAATSLVNSVGNGIEDFLARVNGSRRRLSHARSASKTEIVQRLERLRSFLHANAGQRLTLEDLARQAALSPFHLARSFSEVYGVPPLSYHRALRLDRAAAKLRSDSASPTQLAEDLGYANLSAFTRAFSKRFGMPPVEFARRTS